MSLSAWLAMDWHNLWHSLDHWQGCMWRSLWSFIKVLRLITNS
jgi:hypothetical protein